MKSLNIPSLNGALAVNFSQVSKQIDQRLILQDICFDVRNGETLAIAGVNGAGKSTLLRCLLDFMKVTTGHIEIYGTQSTTPSARKQLTFLPERFVPPGHLSGHETLVWLAGLHGGQWSKEQSTKGFAAFEIDQEALHRPLKQFSKGMTQKIGLMACLLSSAPLVVLDEPMSGLDPQARRAVTQALINAKREGRTILLTSHSMQDIEELSDRMVIIDKGTLVFLGKPLELRLRYFTTSLEEAFIQSIEAKENLCPA